MSSFIHLRVFLISILISLIQWLFRGVLIFTYFCALKISVINFSFYPTVIREHILCYFYPIKLIILFYGLACCLSWRMFYVHVRRMYIWCCEVPCSIMSVRCNCCMVAQVFSFLAELLLTRSILRTHESWRLGNSIQNVRKVGFILRFPLLIGRWPSPCRVFTWHVCMERDLFLFL